MMFDVDADCNEERANPQCKLDPSGCGKYCRLVRGHKGRCDCYVMSEGLPSTPGYKGMKRFAVPYPIRRVRRRIESGVSLAVPKSGEHVRSMMKAQPPSPPASVPKLPPPSPPHS